MRFEFGRLGFVSRLAQSIRARSARARQWREFGDLAACGALDDVLAEAGLSRADLPTIMRAYPESAQRHKEMRHWTGVDSAPLPPVAEVREAQMSCVRCTAVRDCDHWLALPAGKRPVPTFCPNIGTFRRLRAWQAGHAR